MDPADAAEVVGTVSLFDRYTESMAMTIYCHWERDRFPESEFYVDPDGRSVHRATPTHTKEGVALEPKKKRLPPAGSRPRLVQVDIDEGE
jgi:hypothetical protein